MRRLLLALACVAAFAAFAAVAASGNGGGSVTLTAEPATTAPGHAMTVSGVLTLDGIQSVEGRDVELYAYDNAQCAPAEPNWVAGLATDEDASQWPTDADGRYSYVITSDAPGTYWLQAVAYPSLKSWDVLATSDCVPVTFAVAPPVEPPKPASSFLCWNRWMTDPVAYEDRVADEMWATGNYLEPQAILGSVEGGTNLGAYHLVCNAPSTMKPTGEGLGGSGEVYSTGIMAEYHSQHPGGNDLNVYHIYQ